MASDSAGRHTMWEVAWVLGSSLIWAAVVGSTGEIGWPLIVWALTTFAPLAERHRRSAENP